MSNSNYADGDDVMVKGDDGTTNGANITATIDGAKKRLDVSSKVDGIVISGGFMNCWNAKLRFRDMNESRGGVARNTIIPTTFTQIYSYTGSGYLAGILVNLENKDKWYIRLVVDGQEILEGSGGVFSEDLHKDAVYDIDDSGKTLNEMETMFGLMYGSHDRFLWSPPLGNPLLFTSSVKVYVRHTDGNKKFKAGAVFLQEGF